MTHLVLTLLLSTSAPGLPADATHRATHEAHAAQPSETTALGYRAERPMGPRLELLGGPADDTSPDPDDTAEHPLRVPSAAPGPFSGDGSPGSTPHEVDPSIRLFLVLNRL